MGSTSSPGRLYDGPLSPRAFVPGSDTGTIREFLSHTTGRITRRYADAALSQAYDRDHLFAMRGRPSLIDQSAMVQVLALLGWDPGRYRLLA